MNHSEFLEDTIAFYSSDTSRRAICQRTGNCSYLAKNGNKCAIGRYIKEGKYNLGMEGNTVGFLLHAYRDSLPDWFNNLKGSFLALVQHFHDENAYWQPEKGLTKIGEKQLCKLRILAKELDNKNQ